MLNEENNENIINETPPIDATTPYGNKASTLASAKQDKLNRLSNKNQNANLDNSYSQLEDGSFVSNRNKIHNDLSDQEFQDTVKYAIERMSLNPQEEGNPTFPDGTSYDGRTRRLYMFGTKDKTNEQVKLGLARGDLPSSKGRYIPNADGTYGWVSGDLGVDVNDMKMDILFPDNVATMIEGVAYGRKSALGGRVLQDRPEEYTPYTDFTHTDKDQESKGSNETSNFTMPQGLLGKALGNIANTRNWEQEDVGTVLDFMDRVADIESNNVVNRTQGDSKNGIGRGKYQFELSTGSGANKTAVNRLFQAMPSLGVALDDIPLADKQILVSEDPDFSKLSEDVQDLVFIADKFQAGDTDLDAIAKGDMSLKDAWLDTHWKGDAADRDEKSAMWDERFKNASESSRGLQYIQEGNKRTSLSQEEFKQRTSEIIKKLITSNNYDDYGSGGSEYYTSREALFGKDTEYNEEQGKTVFNKYIADMEDRFPRKGIVNKEAYLKRQLESDRAWAAERQTALGEAFQTLSALPAGIAKGAMDLLDVALETATYVPQSIIRATTGDRNYDIDLFDDGFKKAAIEFADSVVGYDRYLDEAKLNKAMEQLKDTGVDITSWDSIVETMTDDEKRSKAGSAFWTLVSDPSLTASMITEVVGSGGVLGAVGKTSAKVAAKISPAFQKTVSNALQSNLSKLQVDVAAATKIKDFAKVKELQDSHTLLKKIPDLIKGNYYTNADMMVRMNNDITTFKENNNDEEPSVDKLLGMAILNRIASTAEVISLKSLVGIKDIPATVAKEATRTGVIRAAGEVMGNMAKGGVTEGVQETFDSVVEQVNQKVGSADFEGKSIREVLSESSAEILTGTFAGIGSGVQLGGFKPVGTLLSQGLGKIGQNVLDKKVKSTPPVKEELPATDLDTEALATAVTEADTKTNATISAYANMVDDEEFAGLVEAVGAEGQEKLDTPILKEQLKNSDKTYADIIEDVEQAETNLENRKGTDKETKDDELYLRLLTKVKGEAAKSILESEKLPTLGSGFSPEDVVEDFLTTKVNVEGNLDITDDEKALVNKFLKNNGQKPFRFDRIAKVMEGKDASQVYEDSMASGANSAPNRRARLKKLVNTAGVSKKLISNEIDGINNFLNTQVTRKELYEVAEKSLQTDIDAYNKNKNKPGASAAKPKKTMVEGLGKNYLDVQVDSRGNYKIKDSSRSILNSIDDNIDHLETTLNRYNKATTKILGTSSGSFLAVPVSNRLDKKTQGYRENDVKFYETHKPTKVIVDDAKDSTSAKRWQKNGDYRNINESKVVKQSTPFTAEDTVLLTTLDVKGGSVASKTLSAAIKAGATIVVDPSLLKTKNANGKFTSNSIKVKTLAKRYKAGAINANGAIVFKPRAEVAAIQAEGRKKSQAKSRENNVKSRLKAAFDTIVTARELSGKATPEQQNAFSKAREFAREYFPASEGKTSDSKILSYLANETAKEAVELEKILAPIMVSKGTNSKEYSEAVGKASKTALRIVQKNLKAKEQGLAKGGKLVKEWKNAQEIAKKGGEALSTWVKSTFKEKASGVVKSMLTSSKGKKDADKTNKPIYSYIKKGQSKYTTTTVVEEAEKFSEDGTYTVIEVDPNRYVEVSEATVLNTLDISEIKVEGEENIEFNNFVEEALSRLESVLAEKTADTKLPFTSIDSPAASLIYDTEGKLNANFAVAARTALYYFVRNSSYLLTKEGKTIQDIAEILGKHESELSIEAITAMQEHGLMMKTVADSIGKDIAKLLGIKDNKNPEVDGQAFGRLITELGQIAILMGTDSKEGLFNVTEMGSEDFAVKVLGKQKKDITKSESVVKFVSINKQENVEEAILKVEALAETLPGLDVRRKEPSFKKIDQKAIDKSTEKPRKESLGVGVANKSKKAMEEQINTEMSADMKLLREVTDLKNEGRIKKLLGHIEIYTDEAKTIYTEEFKKLSHKEQLTQASKNREVEQSIAHLKWLDGEVKPTDNRKSMWFNYFFSKNGRFFVDSNTINPQNDKHLHRFIVQALENNNTFTTKGKGAKREFTVNGKPITASVHYALAQAFGFATDKKKASTIKAFSENILANITTITQLNKVKEAFLDNGKVETINLGRGKETTTLDIEMEHLGHALQGFDFMENMLSNKPFDSSLSAEFDAVTSGFGLKLLQMPVVGPKLYEWLAKVGIVRNTDSRLADLDNNEITMNNLLDLDGFMDSYQELASSIEQVSYAEMKSNTDSTLFNLDDGYPKALWEAVSKVLPQVSEGVISFDLRTLFKYPFMTFNYASSIKSIRGRLKYTVQDDIAKQIAALDLDKADMSVKEKNLVAMMEVFIGGDLLTSLEDLQALVREKPLFSVKVGDEKSVSLGRYLEEMIDASYGTQVQNTLEKEFAPFVKVQDTVNNSFKALFEVFIVSFEEKLLEARKKGVVSAAKEKEIYESLKNKWPAIKGPLSNMEEEFSAEGSVGIYTMDTASPFGVYAGQKAATTTLSESAAKKLGNKSLTTSHMIKALSAAISAGSVIPIHYIDGAVMADVINGMGGDMTTIHDAIIVSLVRMDEGQKLYNKSVIERSMEYSFIDELVKSLDRVIADTELYNDDITGEKTSYQKAVVKLEKGKSTTAADYIISMRNEIAETANQTNAARKELFDTLAKGAQVMHMAGTSGGVYKTGGTDSTVKYKEVDRYLPIPDNIKKQEKIIAEAAKNLC